MTQTIHPPSRPDFGFTIEAVKQRNSELNETTEWQHIQMLHDNVIEAQNEFNTALKAYRNRRSS